MALLHLIYKVTAALNNNELTLLAKALDTVDNHIFFNKL